MKLLDYIDLIGDNSAAKIFEISPRTITAWRYGERCPSWQRARDIERITQGKVSFSECFPLRPEDDYDLMLEDDTEAPA